MKISWARLVGLAAVFFVLFDNTAFFSHVLKVYPFCRDNIGFLISLAVGLTAFIVLLFSLICWPYTTKPVLITLLLLSSLAAYFMNHYNVVFDHVMVRNIVQTNPGEAADLVSGRALLYLLFLGVLPSLFVLRAEIRPVASRWRALGVRAAMVAGSTVLVLGLVLLFSRFYTSFFREHKPLRYYTNPTFYIYSVGRYIGQVYGGHKVAVAAVGEDARIPVDDLDRELVILVVGEAARADRFSLNGYERQTNPRLSEEDVVSFPEFYSCGTSTSYSVPCMFSGFGRRQFSSAKGEANENLLDVLRHAGVHILWRDNNSDSKGVAVRAEFQDYKQPEVNPVCDVECRDVGMLVGLQEYIDRNSDGDILIVLHQMGNHGPAYYKRYPAEYERFTPVCRTNQFDECSDEEISNAYDNAILYTDYFLSRIIALLKKNSRRFETAMVYISDHGESLGEYDVYLHGLPYAVAPEVQKHVGAIFWFGESFKIDRAALKERAAGRFSQDNLFHTILGIMEVESDVYDQRLDITSGLERREP